MHEAQNLHLQMHTHCRSCICWLKSKQNNNNKNYEKQQMENFPFRISSVKSWGNIQSNVVFVLCWFVCLFFFPFPGLSELATGNKDFVATCDKWLCSLCVETLPSCLITMTLTSSVALRLLWLWFLTQAELLNL